MNILFKLLCSLCLLSIAGYLNAQTTPVEQAEATCPAGIPATAEDALFVSQASGEMLHVASNLIFMRCSLGQTWDGSTCMSEPKAYNWQQALQASVNTEFNNLKSWRLPNIKELSVITERACVRPAVNDAIFPNTSPDDYWTSTPSMQNENEAWSVAFTNASNSLRLKDRSLFVRLVRTKLASE